MGTTQPALKAAEITEEVVANIAAGGIAEHLTTKDMTGAIRDIFKDPVIINGKQYDHLGEVNYLS